VVAGEVGVDESVAVMANPSRPKRRDVSPATPDTKRGEVSAV
jgi:hypothetical protein